MKRDALNDLVAFVAVADARSFTRAAARLGLSASGLSHAMNALEERLGVRLLARTTRSVAPTEAGERLLGTLRPALAEIGTGLTDLVAMRDRPAGTIRITTFKHAAVAALWPVLPAFLTEHPDIRVEVMIDDTLTDLVAGRYDAGIRWGDRVGNDMVAVRIGPDIRAAVVAAPSYLAGRPVPEKPQELANHRCINYRMADAGDLLPWEFEHDGQAFRVRVDGPLTFNDPDLIRAAALAGQGIAYLLEDQVADDLAEGRLVRMLSAWSPVFPGFHLYHPDRRHVPAALAALIAVLRVAEAPAQSEPAFSL